MTENIDNCIGIVTVLYNSDDLLPGFFNSLSAQQDAHFRLYVIDNSATNSGVVISKALGEAHCINVTCIFNNSNVGVAKGNNQGIKLALDDGCSHVLLANNDTEFGPLTISTLYHSILENKDLVATPKILYYNGDRLIWYAGGHTNAWRMLTPHYGINKIDSGQFDDQEFVNYAPTCFMLLDRSVFDVVGLMDERFFVYFDDTDFVWRMIGNNIRIRFVSSAVVLHKVSACTGGNTSAFAVYYTNRNRIFFLRKHLHGLQKFVAICYILMTRPRLFLFPWKVNKSGWRGLLDGLRMPLVVEK